MNTNCVIVRIAATLTIAFLSLKRTIKYGNTRSNLASSEILSLNASRMSHASTLDCGLDVLRIVETISDKKINPPSFEEMALPC